MKKVIGTFKVESGEVTVSDPCYDLKSIAGKWQAVNGDWKAAINLRKDGTVSSLTATLVNPGKTDKWEKTNSAGGVDSGQMSIFDSKFYRAPSEADGKPQPKWMDSKRIKEVGEKFYGACCTLTCGDNSENLGGGVLAHGTVSSSGYGDGVYPVYVKFANGPSAKVVGIKVRF